MRLLPNPERAWERAAHVQTLARAEIERRIEGFERWAAAFDLFNLVGLLDGAEPGSRRAADVCGRILEVAER
ncbi:hypothetical protein ACSRUE_24595 [Sorangium sp. KYC3313]|uniref:hypothetical protein n=1 Tax=Sorangium sp. KYC3313 TaxID=3449740 RepID=UPI003F8AD414